MRRQWAGPLITALIVVGVALIVVLNLDLGSSPSAPTLRPSATVDANVSPQPAARADLPADFREYPIGETVTNAMRVAAVWLPSVRMEGMGDLSGSDMIHLEADVQAAEGNPNGFAKDEFVPYLKITYTIAPAAGGPPIHQGPLTPMVARDGLHYGANVAMPQAGLFRLNYQIAPPSAGGLGRHSDPVTGVAPWWKPFAVTFDWDYPGPPGLGTAPPAERSSPGGDQR